MKMLSSHRDRLLSFLLGAAVLLVFVGAARAQSAAENENLNFQKLYARNLKGMVDDLQPIASADHSKREGGKCWSGYSPEKNEKMSTCCWYGAQTCCKSGAASSFLRAVEQQLEVVHKNGTNDKCYAAIADLLCLWCSPESAKFAEGSEFISVSVCSSLCDKLWGACHDQQDAFGIHPKALTPRQLCTALLVEEEDKDTPQGGVNVVIAPASSKSCFGGVALSLVENSGCLPHVTASTSSNGPSGGAIAAMVLVPFLVIGITAGAVVAYFRMRKRREGLVYLGAGGGGGAGEDEFTLSADAFGEEEGGFLDEEGDISEGGTGLMSDEDSKFSVQ